jgi:hypothetical protein
MADATATVEWVLTVPPDEAIRLLRAGIVAMGGVSDDDAEGESPSALRMSTPRSTRHRRGPAGWHIDVYPAPEDGGIRAIITLTMPGYVKNATLDELAGHLGIVVKSRAFAPSLRAQVASRPKHQARLAKNQERLAKSQEKLATLNAKLALQERRGSLTGNGNVVISFDGEREVKIRSGMFRSETHEIDGSTNAVVDSVGGISSRPTLTRTASGLLLTGGLLGATAWKRTGDLFLLVESKEWAELVELSPKKASEARKFAHKINQAAREVRAEGTITASSAPARLDQPADDPDRVLGQLERLGKLRAEGVLSDTEFENQKRNILASEG